MDPGQERRIARSAARKALETADRLSAVTDEGDRADFIDAVVLGAADRLQREAHAEEAVRLWRAVFFGSFPRLGPSSNPAGPQARPFG